MTQISQHLYETLYQGDLIVIILGRMPKGYYLRIVKTYDHSYSLYDNVTQPTETLAPLLQVLTAFALTIPPMMLTALQQEQPTYTVKKVFYPHDSQPISLTTET